MVRKNYGGWGSGLDRAVRARAEFRTLSPYHDRIRQMMDPFFPFREDWCALQGVNDALDRAIRHFGLDPIDVWRVPNAIPDPDNPLTAALNRRRDEG